MVDNLKYQSAILPKDAGKCALQLLDCLFDTTELVNGNPSGQTNSKDPARKLSIRQLDPDRMKYIYGKCIYIYRESICLCASVFIALQHL